MDFAEEMFKHLKKRMDKDFDQVINHCFGDEGKKALEESLSGFIKDAGDTLDDKKVIREILYFTMAQLYQGRPELLTMRKDTADFIAPIMSGVVLGYRLGQYNSSEQEKQKA